MNTQQAIESILILIKESPSLDSTHPTLNLINSLLEEVRRHILLEGFSFNTRFVALEQSHLDDPSTLLIMDKTGCVIHKEKLKQSLGSSVYIVGDMDFDSIPTLCQYWIIKRVARSFVEQNIADSLLRESLWQIEQDTKMAFLRLEHKQSTISQDLI